MGLRSSATLNPHDFIAKWHNSSLKESAAAQSHFNDLCQLLGERTPAEADPEGRDYAFEYGATKTTGGQGFWASPGFWSSRHATFRAGFSRAAYSVGTEAEEALKKRTLTNLYNARPQWLENAHRALDTAVAAAYGWPTDISDDEALKRLFALNQERAEAQRAK